ncbi:MAG: pyridoxal-phosphate dependent enzyme [Acidobacteria bacterium]|nr:pyridoxal-phosphate dependent enzyme [Acidobacteriota bacterium]
MADSILETIGDTPLVRIHRLTRGVVRAEVLAKLETFNPGHSTKDRMAVRMIEDAERRGRLVPGGVIVEGTSGNTGMGLAMAAAVKGYRCIFTTTDKQSKEKMDALRAFGAEVVVCPTDVDPEDPRSYYSVAARIERETPNAWRASQYDNPANPAAHFEQTGPEIWEQTGGRITQLVCGVGTGGTISGAGRYLKSKNPAIKVWGIDTYGSALKTFKDTGVFDKNESYPYITEGIGEDFLPANVDFDVIDHFEKVTDRDAAIMTRRLTREEGIFAGNSAGAVMAGLLQLAPHFTGADVVVAILHDHGTRYLAKMFNDEWMHAHGFLDKTGLVARDLVAHRTRRTLVTVEASAPVSRAVQVMTEHDYSQVPVTEDGRIVGSVNEPCLYSALVNDPGVRLQPVRTVMQAAFPFVDISTGIDALAAMITADNPAVLVRDFKSNETFIITRSDIIRAMG